VPLQQSYADIETISIGFLRCSLNEEEVKGEDCLGEEDIRKHDYG
jgi:hypothetical protein